MVALSPKSLAPTATPSSVVPPATQVHSLQLLRAVSMMRSCVRESVLLAVNE
jgi:hypothetical protein